MAKLFSAVLLGVLGYFAADAVANHFPPEDKQGMIRPITAFFGVLIGWKFLGRRVNGPWSSAIGSGISAGVILVIASLVWFAGYEMIRRAMRMAYGGNPFEALQDMVQIAAELSLKLAYADVITILLVGSILCGLFAEAIARRWS